VDLGRDREAMQELRLAAEAAKVRLSSTDRTTLTLPFGGFTYYKEITRADLERLIDALVNFDKPLVAAVHGAAVGSGTTMLTHFDFVYAGESAKFQMPFVNLALVPEFGASYSVPAQSGYVAAAELILLGSPFDAKRALELGFVTRVVPDQTVLAMARETAEKLAQKPAGALVASKQLLKRSFREQLAAAAKAESQEFASRVRSAEAKEAFTAFFDKHRSETR